MGPPAPSDPDALLWAHKLKREHCQLLIRVDELQKTCNSTVQQLQNTSLLKRLNDVEDDINKQDAALKGIADELRKTITHASNNHQDLQACIERLKEDNATRLDSLEAQMKGCQEFSQHISLIRNSHLAASKALVQRIIHLENLHSEDPDITRQLCAKMESLQQDIMCLKSGSHRPRGESSPTESDVEDNTHDRGTPKQMVHKISPSRLAYAHDDDIHDNIKLKQFESTAPTPVSITRTVGSEMKGAKWDQQSVTRSSLQSPRKSRSLAPELSTPRKIRQKSPEVAIKALAAGSADGAPSASRTALTDPSPIRQGMITRQLKKEMRRKSCEKKRKSEESASTAAPKKPKKRDIPQDHDLPPYEEYIKA